MKCAVKINDLKTDWFHVRSDLKKGVSPTLLFDLYINDLSNVLSKLNKGIWNQSTIISLDWLNTFRIYFRTNGSLVHWSVRRQV